MICLLKLFGFLSIWISAGLTIQFLYELQNSKEQYAKYAELWGEYVA